jgi:hypothetical protein
LLDYVALTKDNFADPFTDEAEAASQRCDVVHEIGGGGIDGCRGSQAERSFFKVFAKRKPD